jgi:hypothetical protein
MRPARCNSGDEVGWGSTGELAHFHWDPLRQLQWCIVVGVAVERARWQWWQWKAKCSLAEEGKRNGARLREGGGGGFGACLDTSAGHMHACNGLSGTEAP